MAQERIVTKRPRARRVLAVAVLAAAAIGASTAVAMAGGTSQVPKAPMVKNAAAAHRERIADFPPAQPLTSAKPGEALTLDAAIAKARHRAAESAAVKGGLPAKGLAMTMAEFNHRTGLGADPDIAPGREVFVITVHGTMSTDALPGNSGSTQHVYTDVFDAATGTLIEEGIGYDILN